MSPKALTPSMNEPSATRYFWIWALLAIVGAYCVLAYLLPGRGSGDEDLRKMLTRLDALEARLEAQQKMIGEGDGRQHAGTVSTGTGQGLSFEAPGSLPAEVLNPERAQRAQEKIRSSAEAHFRSQSPAPVSDQVPQQITAAFNSDNVLGAIDIPESKHIHCRARTCLIRARFPPGADDADWATRMMLELGPTLPGYRAFSVPQPDGGLELRIYASRPE